MLTGSAIQKKIKCAILKMNNAEQYKKYHTACEENKYCNSKWLLEHEWVVRW